MMTSIAARLRAFSPKFSVPVFKAVLVAMVASAFVVPLALVALPFIEFFNGMAVQPKGRPQSLYGRLYGEERLVERAAVAGSVPRGVDPYPFPGNDDETAKLAGEWLVNPVPRTLANLERGRRVFDIYCIVCHGKLGLGDGSVVGPNRFPAPPSLHTDAVKNYPDGQVFHLITRGKGKMPSYASRIRPEDRWAVVNYVRVLQRALDPKPGDPAK